MSRFQRPRFVRSLDWRVEFTLGILAGAFTFAVIVGEFSWLTDVSPWRLVLGGLLVGTGTRLGEDGISGHDNCGVGSGAKTSIVNLFVFMVVAIGVAQIVFALGVRP